MSLQAAIAWVQDQVLTLPGVGAAPDYPTDLAGGNLWVYVYPASGEIDPQAANWGKNLDTLQVQILTNRGDLSESMQRLAGFPHNIAQLIVKDPSLGGNVATFRNMTYTFTASQWAGVEVIGYTLNINGVKTLTTH